MARPKGTGRKGEIRYLNEQELSLFMKQAKKNKMYDLAFSLCLSLGLRVSELSQIKLQDFNPDSKELKVQGVKKGRLVTHTLSERIWRKLQRWLKERKKMETSNGNPFLFPHRFYADDHLTRDGFQGAFRTLCKKAGIENHSIHDLRHTVAVRLVEEGEKIVHIRDRLRHRDIRSTQTYFDLVESKGAQQRHNQILDKYL